MSEPSQQNDDDGRSSFHRPVNWDRNPTVLAKNKFGYTPAANPVNFFKSPEANAQPVASQPSAGDQAQTSSSAPPESSPQPLPIGNFGEWAAYHQIQTSRPYFYCHRLGQSQFDCPPEIKVEFDQQYPQFLAKNGLSSSQGQSQPQPQPQPQQPPQSTTLTPPVFVPPPLNASAKTTPTTTIPPEEQNPLSIPLPITPTSYNQQPLPSTTSAKTPPPPPAHVLAAAAAGSNIGSQSPIDTGDSISPRAAPIELPGLASHPSGVTSRPPPFTPTMANTASKSSHTTDNIGVNRFPVPTLPNRLSSNSGPLPKLPAHFGDVQEQLSMKLAGELKALHLSKQNTPPIGGGGGDSTSLHMNPSQISSSSQQQHQQQQKPVSINPNLLRQFSSSSAASKSSRVPPPFTPSSIAGAPHPYSPTGSAAALRVSTTTINQTPPVTPLTTPKAVPETCPAQYTSPYSPLPLQHNLTDPLAQLMQIEPKVTQKEGTMLKLTMGFRKIWKPRYTILYQGTLRYWDDQEDARININNPNAKVAVPGCSILLPPMGSGVHPKYGFSMDVPVGDAHDIINETEKEPWEITTFTVKFQHITELDDWTHVLYRNGSIDARYVLNPNLTLSDDEIVEKTHLLFDCWAHHTVAPETVQDAQGQTSEMKGLYSPHGIYGYKPIPVPIHYQKRRSNNQPYYAVLFADRIELYDSYDDAAIVCNYHNPDINITIQPETIRNRPKIEQTIPLTAGSSIQVVTVPHPQGSHNDIAIKFTIADNKIRRVKAQVVTLLFDECNIVTGQLYHDSGCCTAGSVASKWKAAINYLLEGPITGVFKSTLYWATLRSPMPVPLVLHSCIRYCIQHGLREEGLLRVPGNNELIQKLKKQYNASFTDPVLTEPNTSAGLLKLFLRENADGLIPEYLYKDFTSLNCRAAAQGASPEVRTPRVTALSSLVGKLPRLNHTCLSYLVYFLTKIAANSDENRMYAKNCAMVLAPNVFRQPGHKSEKNLRETMTSQTAMAESLVEQESILLIMIEHYQEIFPRGSPFIF